MTLRFNNSIKKVCPSDMLYVNATCVCVVHYCRCTGEIPLEELLAQYGVQLGSAGSTPASTEGTTLFGVHNVDA